MRTISASELKVHTSKDSCWIAVYGKVYDVTPFLNEHPGGAGLLIKSSGKDATDTFETVHNSEIISETLPEELLLGEIDSSSILPEPKSQPSSPSFTPITENSSISSPAATSAESPSTSPQEATESPVYPPLSSIINADDFTPVAQKYLTSSAWAYYSSAADDETALSDNTRLYRLLKLRPRVLRDVSTIDLSTTILGRPSSVPFFICPTGLAKYAHPKAELNIASAAGKENVHQIIPTAPSMTLEQIAGARSAESQTQYSQLYVNRDRTRATAMICRAEKAGMKGLFVTVDSPVLGKRERDDRIKAADNPDFAPGSVIPTGHSAGVAKIASSTLLNPFLKWEDLKWLRSVTNLPIVLKGIQTVDDALLAYHSGVQGIYLSNHGGRSQDTAQAPILTLLEIKEYAPQLINNPKLEIFIDGSIKRGTDIIKCLALGATAVGVGRPWLYSMCGGYGEEGVRHLMEILKSEVAGNMALVGARRVKELVPEMVNTKRAEMEVFGGVRL